MSLPKFIGSLIEPGLHWLRIADGSWRTTFGAHIYVIGSHEEVVIVDTAYDKDAPSMFLLGYLAGIGGPRVKALLLTHHHTDHSGGAAKLRAVSGAPIWSHPLETRLVAEATAKPDEEGQPAKPATWPNADLADGQVISAGGVEVQVVHTPGHSPGHCCFFLPATGTMLTGDLVLGDATTSVSPPHGNMALLLKSFERLLEFPMKRIGPAHGPLIEDPIENVRGILKHRLEREQQVMDALAKGFEKPVAIVPSIYIDLEPRLVELAQKQVTSILAKLERDGLVESAGEGEERTWRLVSSS